MERSYFGGLMTWGRNSSLQLGFESDGSVFNPTLLSFQSIRAIQVACGEDFTAFLSDVGEVFLMGRSIGREEEVSPFDRQEAPLTPLQELKWVNVRSISAGSAHLLCLTSSGEVLAIGNNAMGQLGTGDFISRSTCVSISSLFPPAAHIIKVAACANYSVALSSAGDVYVWGDFGEAGGFCVSVPTEWECLTRLGVKSFACGTKSLAIITYHGKLYTIGSNVYRQLGHSFDEKDVWEAPRLVEGLPLQRIVDVALTTTGGVVLTESGNLFQFGSGLFLGISARINPAPPVRQFRLVNARRLFAGASHVLAILEDGSLWSVGEGSFGKLGLGSMTDKFEFKEIVLPGARSVRQASCGPYHTACIV